MHLYFFAGNCTENLSRKTGGAKLLLPGLFSHGIPVLFTGSGLRIAAVFCIAIYFVFISAPGNEEKKIVCFGDSLTSCGGKNGRYSDMLQKSLPSYIFINSKNKVVISTSCSCCKQLKALFFKSFEFYGIRCVLFCRFKLGGEKKTLFAQCGQVNKERIGAEGGS